MERDDLPTLRGMGFEDAELKELGLWVPAIGDPSALAEMYIRRSKKKDSLSSLREQVRRICQHAEREGIRIRHVWFEQVSASKSYVRREEFENATGAVITHRLSKTLYVFKTSRLSRRGMGQVGLLLEEFEKREARVYVVAENIDSSKSRMILAIISEQARDQAADLSQFVKLGKDASKAEGRYTGGRTPYGLMTVGGGKLGHNPDEYPLARRIAEYLLADKPCTWIASRLNSEGLVTRNGKNWDGSGIAQLARSLTWAATVGQREKHLDANGQHKGVYRRGGTPLRNAEGHPISMGLGVITFAEYTKIQALLKERMNRPEGAYARGSRQAQALLPGILRCDICKGPMLNGGESYRCSQRERQGTDVCGGTGTLRKRADDAVTIMWLNHILSLSPDSQTIHDIARGWLSYKDPEKEERKAHVSAALESAVTREMQLQKERFILNRINEVTYEYLWRELSAQIERLKKELAELSTDTDLSPLMDPESLAAIWEGAGNGGRRALLRAALKAVYVTKSYRGDQRPIMDRLVPEWRENASDARTDELWEQERQ